MKSALGLIVATFALSLISSPPVGAAEYLKETFRCSISGTKETLFIPPVNLPFRDHLRIAVIREKQQTNFIASGFAYHQDAASPIPLSERFFDYLWRHAEISLTDPTHGLTSTELRITLDHANTIQLLQHLGATEIASTDPFPVLEVLTHSTTPQKRQTHLPEEVKDGLSVHLKYECADEDFDVSLIGRPRVEFPVIFYGGQTHALINLTDIAPPWAKNLRALVNGVEHLLPVSKVAAIPLNSAGRKYTLHLGYVTQAGAIGPQRIVDIQAQEEATRPRVQSGIVLDLPSAQFPLVFLSGNRPPWARRVEIRIGGDTSGIHPLQDNLDLNGYFPKGLAHYLNTASEKMDLYCGKYPNVEENASGRKIPLEVRLSDKDGLSELSLSGTIRVASHHWGTVTLEVAKENGCYHSAGSSGHYDNWTETITCNFAWSRPAADSQFKCRMFRLNGAYTFYLNGDISIPLGKSMRTRLATGESYRDSSGRTGYYINESTEFWLAYPDLSGSSIVNYYRRYPHILCQ